MLYAVQWLRVPQCSKFVNAPRSPAQFRLVYRRHGEPIVTERQRLDQSSYSQMLWITA
jgi:hypothetical protein